MTDPAEASAVPALADRFARREEAAPPARSVTHQHLLNVVVAHLARRRAASPVRVLDAGCGDGLLLDYLAQSLGQGFPAAQFEFHGFDVSNHGVQPPDYFSRTIELLERRSPRVPWKERLALVSDRDPWPWPAGRFDVVVSNQVLEHVRDHRHFFSELRRTLAADGFSVHLFPTRDCIVEPHLDVPFAHRIRSRRTIERYLEFATRLGLGRYVAGTESRRSYAVRHADYLAANVNYKSVLELRDLAAECGLRASYGHTGGLYRAKLRALLGGRGAMRYRTRDAEPDALAATFPFRFVSSVTLLLTRDDAPAAGPATDGR